MWQKIFKGHKMHSCILATTAHKWSFGVQNCKRLRGFLHKKSRFI